MNQTAHGNSQQMLGIAVIKNFLNADLREKLSDATIETLAIIAYRQPISRAEIEAIRGLTANTALELYQSVVWFKKHLTQRISDKSFMRPRLNS